MEAEYQHWKNVSGTSNRSASVLVPPLGDLVKSYNDLASVALKDVSEVVENVDLQLSTLWKERAAIKSAFTEDRMRSIFHLFDVQCVNVVQKSAGKDKIWTVEFYEAEEFLSDSVSLCDKWREVCRILTEELWPEDERNKWCSGPVEAENVEKLKNRLNHIRLIRETVEEGASLLGSVLEKPFPSKVFEETDSSDISPNGEERWLAAVRQYDQKMSRYDDVIAERLKKKFYSPTGDSRQMISEFQKCENLLKRPKVKTSLTTEREMLLGHVGQFIDRFEQEYDMDSFEVYQNNSSTVSNMIWTRQILLELRELDSGLQESLGDVPKFEAFYHRLKTLLEAAENRCRDRFDAWCNDILRKMKQPKNEFSLDLSSPLLQIEQPSGRLSVNFSDRLIMLIKEVRYLESIGFRMPEEIKERSEQAKKQYESGIVLMQVAHFYNTIDQQMVHCQKPMMIESAKRFERVIRSGGKGSIRWTDTKKVTAYIGEVHEATLALTQENRRLRNLHEKITTMITQMSETSLLQKTAEWKRMLNDIHKIILTVAVEAERYPPENVVPWRLDIDQQIRKALELQMKKCLVQLSENLSDIQVDLVYRNNTLQFRPSLEEIRESFATELKKLYELPASFKPLSEVTAKRDLFRQVVANCQAEKDTAERNIEELVKRLEGVIEESQKYIAMGTVDIGSFQDPNSAKTVLDYDVEMKALKQRGKATEHLPSQIKVENVVVNLSSLRNTIDGLLQDTYEALSNALRQSLLAEVQTVSAFVDDSNTVFSARPSSTEELQILSLEFLRLVRESEEMKPRLSSIEEKNALLKSVTGRGTDKSESVLRSWNAVSAMLEDHKSVMKEQTAALEERVQKDLKGFEAELEKFEARWNQARPSEDLLETLSVAETKKVAESVQSRREDLQKLIDKKAQLEAQCKQLNLPPPRTKIIDAIIQDFEKTEQAWKDVTEFTQNVDELGKEDWLTFRNKLYRFEEVLKTWSGKMQTAAPTAFTLRIQQDIARYRAALPFLKAARGDAFSDEHWGELFGRLGLKNTNIEQLTFGDFIGACGSMISEGNAIKDLAARAQAEVSIREALRELEIWAATASFHLTSHSDSNGSQIQIVKDWAELLTTVGEKQRLLQSTKDSQHYGKFADRIAIWEQRLIDLSFLLDNLHQIQRKWVYLEPICSRNTLPNEEGRFKRADADFRGVLKEMGKEARLLSWMRPVLKNLLPNILDQLQRCQKALNEFLETNRLAFPRFYFIGDDDLLEILGQASNPKVLQAHLKKLFAGVHSVEFGPDGKSITSVRSPEGEMLQLRSPVSTTGSVEIWLGSLSQELKRSLMALLKECLKATFIIETIGKFPSQVLRLSERIKFTELVEKAMKVKGLESVRTDIQKRLNSLTNIQHSTTDLVRLATIQGLILDNIHSLDIMNRLLQEDITGTEAWLWQKQLRYYTEVNGAVTVRMVDAEFQYSFEYHGCLTGLVHTPLTDKCFLTLTQAMLIGLGGNPYGPAGTGKTESVKELGAHLGRQVLVFNCDEGIDPTSMGRIFIGLLKCGAWGCFDEFNRLDELTMSAISTQIMAIQAALKDSSKQLELLDRKVDINREAGIFVTLNPASKGYGGRQKLPDNLKQLFRPIAMSVPDAERIAEVMFLAEGFHHAAVMGKKLVVVYSSAKQLLSQQQHYDWGLRAIKSTIQMAGRFLASQKASSKLGAEISRAGDHLSEGAEASAVVQAVKSNMLSKLTTGDQNRFLNLMNDGFPSASHDVTPDTSLENALKDSCGKLGFIENPIQIRKALELRDQLAQRIGVVVVGPTTSGKTTVWKLLHAALNSLNHAVTFRVINPTSMPKLQLLGSVNETTREWTDGVLTKCVREVLAQADQTAAWIVLDGDIDPNWIESLNSVLDDNRLLTLPSGERLRFPQNVNLLFETDNLKAASPATVSRMGMVFFSVQDVDIKSVAEAWILRQPSDSRLPLKDHISDILLPAVSLTTSLRTYSMSEVSILQVALRQLSHATNRNDFTARTIQTLSPLVGSSDNALRLANEVLKKAGYDAPDPRQPFNVLYDMEGETLKAVRVDEENGNSVPSQELAARRIAAWLKNRESVLLSGPVGCGKSTVLRLALEYGEVRSSMAVQCTSGTTAAVINGKIKRACLAIPTAQGKILRPKNVDKLVVVVKDLQVVQRDKWGHCQVQSFVRQVVDQGGFFDGGDWVQLEGVQIVVTMNGEKEEVVSSRLMAALCFTSVSFPETEELRSIASYLLTSVSLAHCKTHPLWSRSGSANVEKLSNTLVSLFLDLRQRFSPSTHPHYVFTLKDLTSLILSLYRYPLTDQSGSLLLTSLAHEASRSFRDKLTTLSDRSLFDGLLSSVLKEFFPSITVDREVMFSSSVTGLIDGAPLPVLGRPVQKTSVEEMRVNIQNAVRAINRENCVMEVYVHDALVEDVLKVAHWLGQPGGSVLMAAPSGYGRRTVAVIAAKLQQGVLVKLKIGKAYGVKQFQTDLKRVLELVVVRNENAVLLVEDVQIIESVFLEMVTSLLSGGEYVGLYSDEETEKIHGLLADQVAQENFEGSPADFFVLRVKRNFHCVVTLDNTEDHFTSLCERIPSLNTTFHILSNDRLPENVLQSIQQGLAVAGSPLSDEAKSLTTPSETPSPQLAQSMVYIHTTSPAAAAQSTAKFYQFIRTFQSVRADLTSKSSRDSQRLQAGLDQLTKARNDVMILRRNVSEQHTALVRKQEEAKRAMEEIREGMSGANTQKEEVTILKADLEKEREKLLVREKDIAQELQDVLPMLEGAKTAVNKIKTSDLSEIKSLRAPPTVIHNILEGVLKIFGNKDTSWSAMRAFLTPTIKDEIIRFDAEKVTRENLRQTQAVLEKFKASFDEESAKRGSVAAAPLAAWVKACVKYAEVYDKIAPLAAEKRKLESTIDSHARRVTNADLHIGKLSDRIDILQASFQQLTEEAAVLKIDLNRLSERLKVAQVLVEKLEGEYNRWSSQLKETSLSERQLQVNAVLAAGFVTYLAACSEDERKSTMTKWTERFKVDSFNLLTLMTTESTRLEWRADGLSSDILSMENAVILQNSQVPPLIIDPAASVTDWIRKFLNSKTVEIVDQEDANFQSILEMSVRFGKTLIVEVSDRVDPVLVPLLRRDMVKQGTRLQVEIGDKIHDFNPQFRLYLTTRNSALSIHPQTATLLNIVSFTATRAGLANQLHSLVIECKLPEVERQRKELLKEQEDLKIKLTSLEDSLLNELANSQGNILENIELQESLNKTKSSSMVIEKNLEESRRVKETLDKDQAVFAILANKCCAVYFALRDLHKLNPLYRFGLPMFVKLYQKAVENLAKDDHVKDQLQKFCAVAFYQVIHSVYAHISRSIFKRDRLSCLLQFVRVVRPEMFSEVEWNFFLASKPTIKPSSMVLATPNDLDSDQQARLNNLLESVPDLRQALQMNDEAAWKTFLKHSQCEAAFPPTIKLTPFQQVLVVSALRPDRLISAVSVFLTKSLKLGDLSADTSLKGVLEDSRAETPILIVTAGGADPSAELRDLAMEKAPAKTIQMLAMGQRDVDSAVNAIRTAAENGTWLCLENLHLAPAFFQRVSKEVRSVQPKSSFRLWMTTESANTVPVQLLESALKCVYEAPPGVKQNLQLAIKESTETIRQTIGTSPSSQRFIFLLFWLHAVLQERRNFIPRGWTKFYEFNASDLRSAMRVIAKFTKSTSSSETHIRGLLSDVVYGGRIDLEVDLRVLMSYVQAFFREDVNGSLFGLSGALPLNSLSAFMDYVKQMPEREGPEVLGLPANIDGSFQKSESERVMMDLKSLQLASMKIKTVLTGNGERLVEVASALQKKWSNYATDDKAPRQTDNPLAEFFQQEVIFGATLVKIVSADISVINSQNMDSSFKDDKLSDISRSLKLGETPEKWLSSWEVGPTEPVAYMKAIDDRLSYCLAMINQIEKNMIGLKVDLGKLFHPQTLVGTLRHLATRSSNQPLERLVFMNEWSLKTLKSVAYVVSLTGLRIEGAVFDGAVLKECQYDSPSSTTIPVCHIAWISPNIKQNTPVQENWVDIPVFCTANREQLAFYLSVPCDNDPQKWVRAGVAFVLEP